MSSDSTTPQEDSNDRMVIRCGPVRKLLIRPETYQNALKLISETFSLPETKSQIAFSAKLGGSDATGGESYQEEFTPITERNWASFRDQVKILRVTKQNAVAKAANESVERPVGDADAKRTIKIIHESYGRKYEIKATFPLQAVFRAFAISVSISVEDLKFYDQGRVIEPSDTPSSLGWRLMTTLRALRYYFQFTIYNSTGEQVSIRMKHSSPMSKVYDLVASRFHACIKNIRLTGGGWHRIDPNETASDVYSRSGAEIDFRIAQVGGKPVIYLFPPQKLEATVRLSLEPSWRFDAVYPILAVQDGPQNEWQSIQWEVDAAPDGNLRDRDSGVEVTYLFWEAKTVPKLHRGEGVASKTFIPGQTHCEPEDSVVLPVQKITQYLDHALDLLGLHTSARTDFLTYWLPRFLQHKYIALRFLSQKDYEAAAPLDVSPKPDLVTRVFMIFQGINEDELARWSEAELRATQDAVFWQNIVGTDPGKQGDRTMFTVLEWGGMEVYSERLLHLPESEINLE
ncbi:hypothetical protein FS837_000010 [Tulasnella sp. UAMH 9824]|nr:hypothetical protein FS837_000010 [Tulasnella sp. UAMH 9824]